MRVVGFDFERIKLLCVAEINNVRKYKAEFIKYLIYAHASCDETILHLNFIKDVHKEEQDGFDQLLNAYDELGAKLNRFIHYVDTEWR